MPSATLDWFHHLFLALLSCFIAVALYRFVRHLLASLPWQLIPLPA